MNQKQMLAVPFCAGTALIVLGLTAILAPGTVVKILPLTLGLLVLLFGVYELTAGWRKRDERPLLLPRCVQGGVSVAVGLVLVLNRGLSVVFLGVVLGLWGIISGVVSLRVAAQYRKRGLPGSYWDGGLKIVVGCVMLLFPLGGMTAWAAVLGWFALFSGVCVLVSTLCIYRLAKQMAFSDAAISTEQLP